MTMPLKDQIRAALVEALNEANQNQKGAARLLGISRRKLNYMMMRLEIPRPKVTRREEET